MIKYTPQTYKTPIIALVIFLLVSSLVFAGFSFFAGKISSIIMKTLSMVLLFIAAIFVLRFLSGIYVYALNETDFVIAKCTQNKESTICRLNYQALYEICDYQKAIQTIKKEKLHVTNYCSNLFPQKAYCLFYDMENENGVIVFEPSEAFASELQKRIKVDINL